MKLLFLIEDLERVYFKLQMEAALNEQDVQLSKRLIDVSTEVHDALFKAKSLVHDAAVTESID